MITEGKTKVMVIDDSALVRKVLRQWINSQSDMEVIGVAADPYIAVEKIRAQKPDVITLDIEMPRMDGLTFLRKLMEQHPVPVIIVSSLSRKGSDVAMKALEYGAVEIFLKEDVRLVSTGEEGFQILGDCIRAAAESKVKRSPKNIATRSVYVNGIPGARSSERVIVLGASTGGTTAIHEILSVLPVNTPGMVIVQHMPKDFTKAFAARLNDCSQLSVTEAKDGDRVISGKAFIAPGDKHVQLIRRGADVCVKTWDGPLVNRHKPSVDVLFESAATQVGKNGIGVLLTGMGKDGANGLLSMKKQGALTIAQDEETSIVYGMPKEAIRLQAVDKILPLGEIPYKLVTA